MLRKTCIIVLLLILGIFFTGCTSQRIPQYYEPINVLLGEYFTLHDNQVARIENEDYEIKITEFFNSPCRGQCFWSGVGIAFEHKHDGEVISGINRVQAFGFQTTTMDTDYETYAKLKITKIKPESPQDYEPIYVSLDEEFTLHENQSAIIESEDLEVKIVKFYNSPCTGMCFWYGVGISIECKHNGEVEKGIGLAKVFGYEIIVNNTDFETFADLKINKIQ